MSQNGRVRRTERPQQALFGDALGHPRQASVAEAGHPPRTERRGRIAPALLLFGLAQQCAEPLAES